jgi:hypothetical protein
MAVGCARAVAIALAIIVVIYLAWLLYDTLRPRTELDALYRVIEDAPVSDSFNAHRLSSGVYEGNWDQIDVTGKVCPDIDAQALDHAGLEKQTWSSLFSPAPSTTDFWELTDAGNILRDCSRRSFRFLDIAIDKVTEQCRAKVSVAPTCDP